MKRSRDTELSNYIQRKLLEGREQTNTVMTEIVAVMEENQATAEDIAKMEVVIQYIGNPDFRKWLNDFVFEMNCRDY